VEAGTIGLFINAFFFISAGKGLCASLPPRIEGEHASLWSAGEICRISGKCIDCELVSWEAADGCFNGRYFRIGL